MGRVRTSLAPLTPSLALRASVGAWGRCVAGVFAAFVFTLGLAGRAAAQWGISTRFELSPSIQIEDVDETDAKPHLARLNAYIAAGKWDEAVESLRKLSEEHGDRIVQLDDRRYVNVRDYCHLKVAALPPEALALYRARVDQVAADWYRQGVKNRDERLLGNVAEKLLCSSFGDDALLALGDIALEQGQYDRAREAWQEISPLMRGADGQQVWQVLHGVSEPKQWEAALPQFQNKPDKLHWVAFPDTSLDLAAIRARMVLCSILEGSPARARLELQWLDRLHPQAAGKLAGRDGPYRQTLDDLLASSAKWLATPVDVDWYTFARDSSRNSVVTGRPPLSGRPSWELSLSTLTPAVDDRGPRRGRSPLVQFADPDSRLAFHPLIVGNRVFFCNRQQVFALNAETGQPLWPRKDGAAGRIFPASELPGEKIFSDGQMFGSPRYTMTVSGDLLFARIGSPITIRPAGLLSDPEPSSLICLNLRRQGALEWKYPRDNQRLDFEGGRWAIEGAPVCDGQTVYVGLRRSTFRSEAHVAALDARTGRLLWRRQVCSADTPGHGSMNEATHNLVTLHGDALYYNTNLGAVAALSTRDGSIRWVYRYERARGGPFADLPKNFERDLNPCIYHDGLVMAAPTDSASIFALDAGTGILTWTDLRNLTSDAPPLQHLLGVAGGNLIVTGDSVFWFDVATGKTSRNKSGRDMVSEMIWPAPTREGELGFGRGLLASGRIFWPTQEEIFVLDQNWNGQGSPILDRIQLTRPDTGDRVTGGNLAFANGTLLVTGQRRVFAFHTAPAARQLVPAGSFPARDKRPQEKQPAATPRRIEKDLE